MRGLGISCKWDHDRVTATFVLVEGPRASAAQIDAKVHSSARTDDMAQALADLQRDASGIIRGFEPDAVVVRAPDRPPPQARIPFEATRKRGLGDGVLLAVARETVASVRALSGRDIGVACGSSKADADAAGAGLAGSDGAEAAAAALAALDS